jgi:hypothetical protein
LHEFCGDGLTLGAYFRTRHFAPRLLTDYLAPIGAAIWSAPASEMLDFPAENFVAFFSNHRLLQYDCPVWRMVTGGSRRYVEKLTAAFRDNIKFGCAVTKVERTSHGVVVHDRHGHTNSYDHVVIASDRIASIEMIEAVGEQFWPKYFSQLRDRLLPGGLAGIQAITIQDSLFKTYRREVDFIQRYVSPGGMLPTPEILKALGARFGVPVIRERIFGQDYARTLAIWRSNFRAAWPSLMPSGFDDRFRRLWEYYLAYCEARFLSGNIDVRQVVFAKSG